MTKKSSHIFLAMKARCCPSAVGHISVFFPRQFSSHCVVCHYCLYNIYKLWTGAISLLLKLVIIISPHTKKKLKKKKSRPFICRTWQASFYFQKGMSTPVRSELPSRSIWVCSWARLWQMWERRWKCCRKWEPVTECSNQQSRFTDRHIQGHICVCLCGKRGPCPSQQ